MGKFVFAELSETVTLEDVPVTSPVRGPAKASEVTVPSKYAFLNSTPLVPRSTSLFD